MASNDGISAAFNFIWKIKKFSNCLPGACVKSPIFTVESMDKTRWCLQLRPKKQPNGTHIEFYLGRETDKNEPGTIRVVFELSFLDSYGIQLVKKTKEALFKKGESKGFAEFLEQVVVYNHRRFEYLPENILTACCRMKQIGGLPVDKPVFCSASTLIGVEHSSFHWEIKDFSRIKQGMLRITRKRDPYIRIELSLTEKPEEALQFDISHGHVHKPNMTECKITVVNALENTAYSKKDSKHLEGEVWKFPIFLNKSQLIAEKHAYLQDDVLVLEFDITVSLGVISSVIDGYRSPSLEDEMSSSSENEDYSPTKHERTPEVNTLIKTIREIEKRGKVTSKEIENLEKGIRRAKINQEIKTNTLEILKGVLKEVKIIEETMRKETKTIEKSKNVEETTKNETKTIEKPKNVEKMKRKETKTLEKPKNVEEKTRKETKTLKKPKSVEETTRKENKILQNPKNFDMKRIEPKSLKEIPNEAEGIQMKAIESLKRAMKDAESVKERKLKGILENNSKGNSSPCEKESSPSLQIEKCFSTAYGKFDRMTEKEDFSSTEKDDSSSTEKAEILKIKKDINTLKNAIKEIEKVEEMKVKEIETLKKTLGEAKHSEEISNKDSFTLRSDNSSLYNSAESHSFGESDNKNRQEKPFLEDEVSDSSDNEDRSSSEYARTLILKIEALKKTLKEAEEDEKATIRRIESLDKIQIELEKDLDMKNKEIESVQKRIKDLLSSSTNY